MVQRITVYDDAGTPFEVIPSIAESLIVQHGWTLSPEKDKPLFKEAEDEAVTEVVDVLVEEATPAPVSRRRGRNVPVGDSEDA